MADSPYALRLSHAADWARCAAFVRMNRTPQAAIVEEAAPHVVREEGTAMHWVAQCIGDSLPVFCGVGAVAPNGVTITDELLDGAEVFIAVLRSYELFPWRIEEQLQARRIHPTACGGKPDAFGRRVLRPRIVVPDLKGGFVPVEVFPNPQLIGYLAAILDTEPTWEQADTEVEFVIVQPRAYHKDGAVRKHVMMLRDVYPYFAELREAAHRAMGENAPATSGPQCDNCAARASCSVAHAAAGRALEVAGEADVHDLPVAAIDYEMMRLEEAARMIEARLTGLQAQASHMIRRGITLPHYALESGAGRLNWLDDQAEQAAITIADLMGVDIRKPVKAATPTQAMQRLPKELLERYAQRKRGEVKLVRFDNNAAVKAFSHLTVKKD